MIHALESRFEDNDIESAFKVLNPTNMHSKQVGLVQSGYTEAELFCMWYGVKKKDERKRFAPSY